MKLKVLVLFIAALLIAACDYEFREKPAADDNSQNSANQSNVGAGNQAGSANAAQTNKTAANSNSAPADSGDNAGGDPLILSGTGESLTIACGGREVEVVADATANAYTLTGECKKLTVDGVSNKISVEKVGEISVKGTSNKVAYIEGLGGKKPKITKTGVSTSVDSLKDLEKKAAEDK